MPVAHRRDQGSIFLYILLAIVLFAAVAYTVSRGFNLGSGQTSMAEDERARLQMTEVVEFAHLVQAGVQQMKIAGINPSAIDWARPTDAGFSTAPFTAKIFHPQGGNVTFVPIRDEMDDPTQSTATDWAFVANAVDGIGSSAGKEQLLSLVRVPEALCKMINKNLLGVSTIPSVSGNIDNMFVAGTVPLDSTNCAACTGVPAQCVQNGGVRAFYYVLDRG